MENIEIIPASEAKRQVEKAESTNANRCKSIIKERIENAIGKGKYSVKIDVDGIDGKDDIVAPIQKYLEGLGYKVDHNTGVQWSPCDFYTISWV